MIERFVKLRTQRLQLHSRLQAVRRLRPPADEAVNLFLDVDERLFQGGSAIGRPAAQSKNSKPRPGPLARAVAANPVRVVRVVRVKHYGATINRRAECFLLQRRRRTLNFGRAWDVGISGRLDLALKFFGGRDGGRCAGRAGWFRSTRTFS